MVPVGKIWDDPCHAVWARFERDHIVPELIQASLDDNPNNEQSGAWSQSSPILCFHQKITRLPLFIGMKSS